MDQGSILRQGVWYHQKQDGTWLRYNNETSAWEPSAAPPPPTPPPAPEPRPEPQTTAPPAAATEPVATDAPPDRRRSSYLERYGKRSGPQVNPVVALAVVAALLVAGIGGAFATGAFTPDEENPSPRLATAPGVPQERAPKPLKKKVFLAKADALCGVANSKMDALTVPTSFDPLYLTQVIQINTKLVRNLRKLPPPREDQRQIDRMLTKVERALGYMILSVRSVREGSAVTATRALQRAQGLAAHANKIASAYGLKECSEPA